MDKTGKPDGMPETPWKPSIGKRAFFSISDRTGKAGWNVLSGHNGPKTTTRGTGMLRITQSTSSAGAKKYFDEALTKADYYLSDQDVIPSAWGGKGAEMLGLSGEVAQKAVSQKDFHALCDNLNPATGGKLTPRTDKHRTVGYDFTFSVPKGVSVLHALGDERIVTAFNEAVQATMADIETEMETRVRVGGKGKLDENRTTGNMVWAAFTHTVSRPIDGVPDMHLHQHVYAFNATFDQTENRWKAGQFRPLKRDAPYWEAVFDSRIALKLRALGYGIERTMSDTGKMGWDIARVPESVKAKFSRRTAEIEALAQKLGIKTDALKDGLGAKSRDRKNPDMTSAQLKAVWESRLTDSEKDALAGAASSGDRKKEKDVTEKEAVGYAVEHGFERASVLPERELLRDALKYGIGSVSPEKVRMEAGRGELLRHKQDGRMFVTSRTVLDEEQSIIRFVKEGRGAVAPMGKPGMEFHSNFLNAEQAGAVRHVLSSPDRVVAIKGGAGVGKTTLMQEAVKSIEAGGHKAKGHKVFTFAPSTDAVSVLQGEGFAHAATVARLLVDEKLQGEVSGQVLWLDEAGLVGSKTMRQVFDLAERQNCRVVLSGDFMQHSGVERGDAFRLLVEHGGLKPALVEQIQRQKSDAYRDAVKELSKGDVAQGFDRLERLGAVVEVENGAERYAHLAKDYANAIAHGETALVVSPTHAEGERVTQAIRAELKAWGRLEAKDRECLRLKNLNLTEAQKTDAIHYRPGQIVQFTQNAAGFRAGERFTVARVKDGRVFLSERPEKALPLTQAGRFQVYQVESIGVAKGDTLRITQNARTLPDAGQTARLHNGAVYSVAGFTRSGDIKLADGKGKPAGVLAKDCGFIAHGYCSTSHAAQGKTVDRVLIAESAASLPAADRKQFYVSVSRGRKSLRIYTDDKAALREAVQDTGSRMAAVELVRSVQAEKPRAQVIDFRKAAEQVARLKALAKAYASRSVGKIMAMSGKAWASRTGKNREQPEWER
jgi:conjugative relaxase-like TrwC/TraI family protein